MLPPRVSLRANPQFTIPVIRDDCKPLRAGACVALPTEAALDAEVLLLVSKGFPGDPQAIFSPSLHRCEY